jgi:hypothetical protein
MLFSKLNNKIEYEIDDGNKVETELYKEMKNVIVQQVNQEINSKVYHCFYFKLYHVNIVKYYLQMKNVISYIQKSKL